MCVFDVIYKRTRGREWIMSEPTQEILALTAKYFAAIEKLDECSREKKIADQQVREIGRELYQRMESTGLQGFTHKDYGKVYLSGRPYSRIIDQDKAEAYLKKMGIYDEIMQ